LKVTDTFLFSLSPQDAQDLGISIELLPLSQPDEEFNVSLFFAVWTAYFDLLSDFLV